MMKKVIVNADDFGLTEGVNQAVIEGHKNGIITSTTLMANGTSFDSALTASFTVPTLGVGVHLNLTHGRPVSSVSHVPSIVTPEGTFYPSPGMLAWRVLTRKAQLRDVESELRSQIEKLASTGVRITHVDSHKHIHLLPPIFTVVVRLAREYGIKCIRCPIEPALSALGPFLSGRHGWFCTGKQYLLARFLSTLAAFQERKIRDAGLFRPALLYGLSQTGFLNAESLQELLRVLPEGTSEIMCHPGYLDTALIQTGTRLCIQREMELKALTSAGTRQLVAEMGIELISYDRLVASGERTVRPGNESVQ